MLRGVMIRSLPRSTLLRSTLLLVGLLVSGLACSLRSAAPRLQRGPAGSTALRLSVTRGPTLPPAEPAAPTRALQQELARYQRRFAALPAPRPYFLAYQITDRRELELAATRGALLQRELSAQRALDVELRVGDHRLDNTHDGRPRRLAGLWVLPLDDDPALLRPTIWWATDRAYHQAQEAFARARGAQAVRAGAEDGSDDLSRESPTRHLEPVPVSKLDTEPWERRLRDYSARLARAPGLLDSRVSLQIREVTRYLANSEGTLAQTSRRFAQLRIAGLARAADGMTLALEESVLVETPEELPPETEVERLARGLTSDLAALQRAPLAEPYSGPALLEGRAAAVLFHEVFGHRVEGHRQRGDAEGQTFTKQIGRQVMPAFIDIYDDPTLRTINGVPLAGHYRVDDEGVLPQRVDLVQAGVLRGFLLSRTPIAGFPRSNGHGRREEGHPVVARQGTLVVQPRATVSRAALRALLLAEIKRQGKPYGLRLAAVSGGFTTTGRQLPQAFKVKPVLVYRVYADGREELVRGADIEGTPLTALSQILAAGDDVAIFNGYCGAESGLVPASIASPSVLLARIELARAPNGRQSAPVLPPPPATPTVTP
ncbi:MAG: peptidase U62 [Proteobacteria bacterium]|nr:peptidase U62 [Pseudomonadota bacterium]